MKKFLKKFMAATLALVMAFGSIGVLPALAAEGDPDDPVLTMSVANKIDVALAVGPTTVEYLSFEKDLRAALGGQTPPVPDEDVYIMASQAVSANTTSEFSWWTYDHTRPSADGYGGTATIIENDEEHIYSELSAPSSTAPSSTATAGYLQNGATVNQAPGVWGPGTTPAAPSTAPGIVGTVGAANYVPGIGYQYENKNEYPYKTNTYNADTYTALNNPTGAYPIEKFEMNPDPTNPDLQYYNTTNTRRLRHPYEGNNTHMVSSNSGATMDFYGYPQYAFRDWQYLSNNQKTLKTFEFSIAEDRAFDALDGVGFLFNTEINGSYTTGTQKMSGYLLFLQYANGLGTSMTIYKFKDVNTKDFHNNIVGSGTTNAANVTVDGFNGTTNATNNTTDKPQFIPVASSKIYTGSDFSRRIRIEASPTQVKVYYKGSPTKNDATVLDPKNAGYKDFEDANLVSFSEETKTTALVVTDLQIGTSIKMDAAYIGSDKTNDFDYGFGPMGAYLNHGCARPTHIALQNLSMTVEKVKSLTEVVREPEWHENTIKYLVNLNENTIDDFEENAIIAELLTRLTNDDIYYVGWGSTINAIASAAFLNKHSLKGKIIDIKSLEELYASKEWDDLLEDIQNLYLNCITQQLTYAEQIKTIADEIYTRYWNHDDNARALVTDNVKMSVSGADMQNSADADWSSGKWMIEHVIDSDVFIDEGNGIVMTNLEGQYPYSGQYMSDLETSYNFSQPGLYRIYYRDVMVGELTVHRAPVASFTVALNGEGDSTLVGTSYDPDVYGEANGAERGIKSEAWTWLDIDDEGMLVAESEKLSELVEGHRYLITLTVEDYWGATNSISRLVSYNSGDEGTETLAPIADFTLTPIKYLKSQDPDKQAAQKITLTNKSYDLAGLDITSVWKVYKDDVLYPGLVITDGNFTLNTAAVTVGDLPEGRYKIELAVTNSGGETSASVVKFFDIVDDKINPTAKILPEPPNDSLATNTTLTLTFSDAGGSGFSQGRFAVVTVGSGDPAPSAPAVGSTDWKVFSPSVTRNVLINSAGDSYVFWEATDGAGNKGDGSFGPYKLTKKSITLTLEAAPQDGAAVYGTQGKGVTLTATMVKLMPEDPNPTRAVFFYQGTSYLGSGSVNEEGVASCTVSPAAAGNPASFRAEYGGDANYGTAEAAAACLVEKNKDASATIGEQTNRQYDATAYVPTGVSATAPSSCVIKYVGRDGTVYPESATPPVNAGKYTVIVYPNDNYDFPEVEESFEILPRELVLVLTPGPATGTAEHLDTVQLTGTVSNAVDLPSGSLEFYANNILIGTVPSSGFIDEGGGIYTAEVTWDDVDAGDYALTLKYVPDDPDNYTTAKDYEIKNYNVKKANQTISVTPYNKTFGDAGFTVTAATGGETSGEVTYALISGAGVVSFNSDTREVTILGAGTAVVRATKPGDDFYNAATADITIKVTKKAWSITIGTDASQMDYGDNVSAAVNPQLTSANVSGGAVTYVYEGRNGTGYGPSSTPPTAVGEYTVKGVVAETANYLSAVSAPVDFEIQYSGGACGCVIDSVTFNGDTVTIPYYALEKRYPLTASAALDSSLCVLNHDSLFEYFYEITVSPASGGARIDNATGQLIVYGVEKGDTVTVTVEVTATHAPTGIKESTTAAFTVTRETQPPATLPGPDTIDGSGVIDKNEDDTIKVNVGPGTLTVTYTNGPAAHSKLHGLLTADIDYEFSGGIVLFAEDFIASLHAGEHEFLLELDGVTLVFYLYIAGGDVIVQVNPSDPGLPTVTVTGGDDDLKDSELVDPGNIAEMDQGYNVYIDVIVSVASDQDEMDLIMSGKGGKIFGAFLDIALKKRMRDGTGQYQYLPENLKEVDKPIWLVVDIPVSIQGYSNYVVVRAHTTAGGETQYDELPTETLTDNKLRFESDKFSVFAILYDANPVTPPGGNPGVVPPVKPSNPDVSDKITGMLETEAHIKYINGYADDTVRPDNPITRAEVAAIFFRLLRDQAKNNPAGGIFTDVPGNAWYAQSVNYLVKLGILKGYENGTFRPDQNITRAEFAAVASRFDDLKKAAGNPFIDVRPDYWAYENILSAYSKGWVDGYPGGDFKPQGAITRAEVVAIVNRMLGRRLDKDGVPKTLYVMYSDLTTDHWAFADIIEASASHEYERKDDGYETWTKY
jgi:hypothetical protein